MAGTRLLLTSVGLVQLIVLVAIAFFDGLCMKKDLLCVPLLHETGRNVLRDSSIALEIPIVFPPVSFASKNNLQELNSALQEIKLPEDQLIASSQVGTDELHSVCQDPTSSQAGTLDLWICERSSLGDSTEPARTLLLIRNSTAFLFFSSKSSATPIELLKRFYPRHRVARATLQLQLMIDEARLDAQHWTDTLNHWFRKNPIDLAPILSVRPSVHVEVGVLSRYMDTDKLDDPISTSRPSFELYPKHQVSRLLFSPRKNKNLFRAIVYVPPQAPMVVANENGDTSRHAALEEGDFLSFVEGHCPDPSNEECYLKSINNTLVFLMSQVISFCMGYPLTSVGIEDVDLDTDFTWPHFHRKLWYHRSIMNQYNRYSKMAVEEREFLLSRSTWVAVTDAVASLWMDAVTNLEKAREAASSGLFVDAIQYLDEAGELLERLRHDPNLSEPIDFPLEQYAAIFGPLLLPTLLPLLTSLLRERKRYRQLKQKKREKEKKD